MTNLRGLVVDSTVTFRQDPERPHSQQLAFLDPDRARWFLQAPGVTVRGVEGPGDRTLRYRRGEIVHRMLARSGDSEEVVGLARDETILQLELRRALYLWPDGFDWKESGESKRMIALGPWGSLAATLSGTGLPTRVIARTRAGLPLESLEAITWTRDGDRRRPDGFRLVVDGITIWDERVQSIRTGVRFLDAYFSPPDRREDAASPTPVNAGQDGRIRLTVLPERAERELPLPRGLGWGSAAGRARDLATSEQRTLGIAGHRSGHRTDGALRLRLDGEGRPEAALLVLSGNSEKLPAGWATRPAGPAFSMILVNPDALNGRSLASLRAAAAAHLRSLGRTIDAADGPVYARLDPGRPTTGPMQLTLPLPTD